MRLMVFSSGMEHIENEITALESAYSSHNVGLECYDTNSFEGMQKAVKYTVFGKLQSLLIDDNNNIRKSFVGAMPVPADLLE